jgi:hypothetical protein
MWVCVADPLRLGHELTYFPGNVNFTAADVIVINKANTAPPVRPCLPTFVEVCISTVRACQQYARGCICHI